MYKIHQPYHYQNCVRLLCALKPGPPAHAQKDGMRALSGSTPDYPDDEHETLCGCLCVCVCVCVRVCVSFCFCMAIPKGQC